jgi:hypothetical protein
MECKHRIVQKVVNFHFVANLVHRKVHDCPLGRNGAAEGYLGILRTRRVCSPFEWHCDDSVLVHHIVARNVYESQHLVWHAHYCGIFGNGFGRCHRGAHYAAPRDSKGLALGVAEFL